MKLAQNDQRVQTVCLLILSAIALGATLSLLQSVLIPFVLALFLAICLGPIMDFQVRRWKFPRTLAVIGTLLLSFIVLVGVWFLVWLSGSEMAANAEVYEQKLVTWWEGVAVDLGEMLQVEIPTFSSFGELGTTPGRFRDVIGNTMLSLANSILSILSQGAIVLIFVFFLLIGRHSETKPTGLWGQIQKQITGYLTVKTLVSVVTGVLVGGILAILGIDLALVFGLMAFLLNFIPNVGSFIACLLPVPVVLLTPELSGTTQVLAIGLPAAVELLVGNVVEPKLMGRSLDLHPVTVLFALIFWGFLWGIIGVLLAVPITGVVKILLEHLGLTEVARLMSNGSTAPPEPAASSGT